MITVQKKNLVRNLRQIADKIERDCPERIEAEEVAENLTGKRLVKVTDMAHYCLELTYISKEDE